MFLKTPPEILRRPPLWIIKLTIKLCVFLVHVLSGHYICILVNYSSFLRLSQTGSQFLTIQIFVLWNSLLQFCRNHGYNINPYANPSKGKIQTTSFEHFLACESLTCIEMSQNSAFRPWMHKNILVEIITERSFQTMAICVLILKAYYKLNKSENWNNCWK